MKTLVVYYSKSGSNKYLAGKIALSLGADLEAVKPRMDVFAFLLLFSALKKSAGIKKLQHTPSDYDRIVLCGPIWMGQLVSPLRDFINKYRNDIPRLYFATCCGGGDAEKDTQFGYVNVFTQIALLLEEKCIFCEAFPIVMVNSPDNLRTEDIMKIRLSDINFSGEIQKRFDRFIQKIAE